MGTFLVAIVVAFASGLVVVALLGRYREAACLEDWESILTPVGRVRYDALREQFERELAASLFTYERARAAAERGDVESAERLLDAGWEFVSALAPERERLLRDLVRYTRMLGAVAPLPPLRPAQFQLRELATLAGVGWLAHQFLVTVPERATLRLQILRRGRQMVLRAIPCGGARRARASEWGRIDAAQADWSTLDRESLATFGSVVTALSAGR